VTVIVVVVAKVPPFIAVVAIRPWTPAFAAPLSKIGVCLKVHVFPKESVTDEKLFVAPPAELLSAAIQITAQEPAAKFDAGDSVNVVAFVLFVPVPLSVPVIAIR
jgi:hypothetical protein